MAYPINSDPWWLTPLMMLVFSAFALLIAGAVARDIFKVEQPEEAIGTFIHNSYAR